MTAAAMTCVLLAGVHAAAFQGRSTGRAASSTPKLSKAVTCASSLGAGVKTNRSFCDVVVTTKPDTSVALTIPTHTGTATLLFDLHNRFAPPADTTDPAQAFQRQTAVVAVVRATGDVIDRAVVVGEFRTPQDLFDRITGTGPTGIKAVAPGHAQSVKVTIPAGVSEIGIVGVRQDIDTRSAHAAFTTPGRPIAIVSNVRVEYR